MADTNLNVTVSDSTPISFSVQGGFSRPNNVIVVGFDSSADYVCDGVEDNIQIQQAVDSLHNGGDVYIKKGVYDIVDTIAISNDYVNIYSESGAVLDGSNGTLMESNIFYFEGRVGIKLHDLKLTNCQHVSIQCGGDDCKIYNVVVENSYFQGINIQGNRFFVENNTVKDTQVEFGIVIGGYSNNVLLNKNIINNTSSNKGGIQWGYSGENILISNNILHDCGNGIEVRGRETSSVSYTKDCQIINNMVYNSQEWGIITRQKDTAIEEHYMENFIISNNYIQSQSVGINANAITNYICSNNTIIDTNTGISFDGELEGSIIVDSNKFINISSQGIATSSNNVVVKNNYFNNITYDMFAANAGSLYHKVFNNQFVNLGRDVLRNDNDVNTKFMNIKLDDNPSLVDYPLISYGVVAPVSTPSKIGDIYIDSSLGDVYISKGASNSSDWVKLN